MEYPIYQRYRRLVVESSAKLIALAGIAAGESVYVIGSSPSIQDTNLSLLNGSTVIFLNNAMTLLDRFSPARSFLMVSDHLRAIELRKDCSARSVTCVATTDKVFNPTVSPMIFGAPFLFVMPKLVTKPDGDLQVCSAPGFSDEPRRGFYLGKSVVFPAIQLAHHLGAATISLVGVDMTIGAKAAYFDRSITSNWSEFNYARDGRPHFAVMRDCLRARGCILQNLSVGGVLDVLPHDPERLAMSPRVMEAAHV